MMNVAKKPPTLAKPLAVPSLALGTMSFEKSKATIEAGPPTEIARKQTNRSQEGDLPGIHSKITQADVVSPTTE